MNFAELRRSNIEPKAPSRKVTRREVLDVLLDAEQALMQCPGDRDPVEPEDVAVRVRELIEKLEVS